MLIALLDRAISVDAPVAHLAGTPGKPVWVWLSSQADWCWLLEREDSPWYPTARLFHQWQPGGWSELIEQAQEALTTQRLPGALTS